MAFNHLGLFVSDLRAAERFYAETFGLEVAVREVITADGDWYTPPSDKRWDDAARAGVEMVSLPT